MHTFWGTVDGDQLRLDPEEIPHALKVLRLQPGDALHVLDGSGTRFTGVVRRAHKKEVIAEVQETLRLWCRFGSFACSHRTHQKCGPNAFLSGESRRDGDS